MSLEEIRSEKLKKLEALKKAGINPYPSSSKRTHIVAEALGDFDNLSGLKEDITLVGRIMARREHGGSVFFNIDDGSARIQGYVKLDILGQENFDKFMGLVDIGDFIQITGFLFSTKRNEKTLEVKNFEILSKALLPLPEKWHGITDEDERLRKRYLDLIMSPDERGIFIKKSKFWQTIREFLLKEGGLEVETPVLELIPGGADAEPFETHLKALDIDMYLRISLELSLKKLMVAGYDKVFEIGRIFRNEGIDKEHLQDYAQLELYWAYTDYRQLMEMVESLYKTAIEATLGGLTHEYQGQQIDWSGKWEEIDYYDVFKKHTGLDLKDASEGDLVDYAVKEGIDTGKHVGRGRLIDIVFKKKVRPHLVKPAFLILPPVDVEPLAKRWPEDTNRVERFQIVAGGTELGKGFSELNDPVDQRGRFEEQAKLREKGDKEAQRMDEDFVEALEYGMPPTAGFGISERLFAFIMDKPVRETVFFPLMRPKE